MSISLPGCRALYDLLASAPLAVRQHVLGSLYAVMPARWAGLPPLLAMTLRDLPRIGSPLVPEVARAAGPAGLCGLTGRIGTAELIEGYRRGMFVFSHNGPLKWWSSPKRMVLFFDEARVDKTTRRMLRQQRFRVTFDEAFADVMRACAEPRRGAAPLTWITPRIQELFLEAHRAGHAHSVEVWAGDALVGGAYGLACGRVFFTESLFARANDASKVGFAVLNRHLQEWGFVLNDGKHATAHLASMGMREIPREAFLEILSAHGAAPAQHSWRVDPELLHDGA